MFAATAMTYGRTLPMSPSPQASPRQAVYEPSGTAFRTGRCFLSLQCNRVFSQLVQNGRHARSPPMRSPDQQFRIACEKTLMGR